MDYDCIKERIGKRRDVAGLRVRICLRRRGPPHHPHHQRRQPGIAQTSAQLTSNCWLSSATHSTCWDYRQPSDLPETLQESGRDFSRC